MSDKTRPTQARTWETIESALPRLWKGIDSSTSLSGGTVPYFDATTTPLHVFRKLLDQQIALQQRAHNDLLPIHRLPRPIFIHILQYAYNFFDHDGWQLELSGLHQYAQVSTYWRDTILSTQWFWRAVRSEDGRAAEELRLRRNASAGVIVWTRQAGTRKRDTFLRRMVSVAERWEVVHVEGRDSDALFDCLSYIPSGLKDLTIRLEAAKTTRVLPLSGGATLFHVHLHHVALPWDSVRLRALRSLELRGLSSHLPSLRQLITIISSSCQLSVLILEDWSSGTVLPNFAEDSAQLIHARLVLSSLEIFNIRRIYPPAASFLLTHITTPNACCITAQDLHFSTFSDPFRLLDLLRPTLRPLRSITLSYHSRSDDRITIQSWPASFYTLDGVYTKMHYSGLSLVCSMADAMEGEWSNLFACLAEGKVDLVLELCDYEHPSPPDGEAATPTNPPFPLKSLDHLQNLKGVNIRPGFNASPVLRYLGAPGVCPGLSWVSCFGVYAELDVMAEDIVAFVKGRCAVDEDAGRQSNVPLDALEVPHELIDSLRVRPEMGPLLDVLRNSTFPDSDSDSDDGFGFAFFD
ncbi:hypothetical protein FRB99_007226 [Tulasnella sp. 403]|nr:hypothetical protein FRB99_007226 [Tulasnella sp. 403]